jgi:histidine ammonia-lyase
LSPLVLEPKEGLALINGTQAMTAVLALACADARRLAQVADLVGALSTEALRGTDAAFDARIHTLRPHPGQRRSAANLRRLLAGSAIRESHRFGDLRVQDPYSVRCMPQVHGAVRDVVEEAARSIEIEANSVTDNPLVFPDTGEVLSGGNFHGEPMAFTADFLAIALSELASISERRIEKLTNTAFSGLPPFLVQNAGLNSGFMMAQVTAASLVSENKVLAHPASVDSIPTSADKEDHVSMGMTAALKLRRVVRNVEAVLGIEAVAAAQGIDLLRPLRSSDSLEAAHAEIRSRVAFWQEDREMAPALEAGRELVAGPLAALAGELGLE